MFQTRKETVPKSGEGRFRSFLPFLLSLLFHFVFVGILLWIRPENLPENLKEQISHEKNKENWIEVEALSSKKSRIVQTELVEKSKTASEDAQLGQQNQRVEDQTVSRHKLSQMGNSSNSAGTHSLSAQSTSIQRSEGNLGLQSRVDPIPLNRLGVPLLAKPSVAREESNWASPGTKPEDYLPGMKESDRTALNTREYRFYSYFQRIRQQLDQAWTPLLRERLKSYFRSGKHLASDMDYTTRTLVVLNSQGEVIRVMILGESGTRELDSTAVEAFNQAGPFPNPPKGIVDQEKEVKIPWDFILRT